MVEYFIGGYLCRLVESEKSVERKVGRVKRCNYWFSKQEGLIGKSFSAMYIFSFLKISVFSFKIEYI